MKYFLLILIIFLFYSCSDDNTTQKKTTCKELNCINGTCIENTNGAFCKCDENATLTEHGICGINTCENHDDCSIFKNKICSPDYKCISKCETDNDCVGKNEICLKEENKCINLGIYYTEHPCNPNEYLAPITRTCLPNCKTDNDCEKDKICDGYRHCSPKCSKNSDCPNNKFENQCDYKHSYCSNSYEDLPSRKEIIVELLNRFFPSLKCELPNKEIFTTICGDYKIETNGKNEWNADSIKISKLHPNLIEFSLADKTNEEYYNYLRSFKKIVTDSNFIQEVLPIYNFNIIANAKFWKGYSSLNKNIKGDLIRIFIFIKWKGITIFSHSLNFSFNKNKEIQLIEIPYIYYPDIPKDDNEYSQITDTKNEIKVCSENLFPNNEIQVSEAYLKIEDNQEFPELYFIIDLDNNDYYIRKRYLIKQMEYTGNCSSVENAINNKNNKLEFNYIP